MIKIALEDLEQALKEAKVEPEKQHKILEHLQHVAEEQKVEKAENAAPKQKNEFGVILYDKDNALAGHEFVASIYQIPINSPHDKVLSLISDAARTQNESAKRKKNVIKTIGEACEFLKRSFIKEKNVMIKTKQVVRVIVSNNSLT